MSPSTQAIDHTAKSLSLRYNKEKPIIFNTYQVGCRNAGCLVS